VSVDVPASAKLHLIDEPEISIVEAVVDENVTLLVIGVA
jgi:hypothetical protein